MAPNGVNSNVDSGDACHVASGQAQPPLVRSIRRLNRLVRPKRSPLLAANNRKRALQRPCGHRVALTARDLSARITWLSRRPCRLADQFAILRVVHNRDGVAERHSTMFGAIRRWLERAS
jgi:hypothetical protein